MFCKTRHFYTYIIKSIENYLRETRTTSQRWRRVVCCRRFGRADKWCWRRPITRTGCWVQSTQCRSNNVISRISHPGDLLSWTRIFSFGLIRWPREFCSQPLPTDRVTEIRLWNNFFISINYSRWFFFLMNTYMERTQLYDANSQLRFMRLDVHDLWVFVFRK